MPFDLAAALRTRPVILAPMEDVTDAVFRRICRDRGADLCVTEFVNVEGLLRGCRQAAHKITLEDGDQPTAIQIYGSDADRLAEAAEVAEKAGPAWIDINCGCWVPKIARRGAGAGWLRDPDAMIEMAKMVVERVSMPVTVKTRLGWGGNVVSCAGGEVAPNAPSLEMPILDLARRLEDVGVKAITLHCRTAQMGHNGAAEWSWARRTREIVQIPVIVNGDVRSGADARRALEETGCEGAMVGRYAIEHPWVFREARAMIDRGEALPEPTPSERIALCREHLTLAVEERGALRAVRAMRRYYPGYLKGLPGSAAIRRELNLTDDLAAVFGIFDRLDDQLAKRAA